MHPILRGIGGFLAGCAVWIVSNWLGGLLLASMNLLLPSGIIPVDIQVLIVSCICGLASGLATSAIGNSAGAVFALAFVMFAGLSLVEFLLRSVSDYPPPILVVVVQPLSVLGGAMIWAAVEDRFPRNK